MLTWRRQQAGGARASQRQKGQGQPRRDLEEDAAGQGGVVAPILLRWREAWGAAPQIRILGLAGAA